MSVLSALWVGIRSRSRQVSACRDQHCLSCIFAPPFARKENQVQVETCSASQASSIVGSSRGFDRPKPPRGKCYSHLKADDLARRLVFCHRTSFAAPAETLY